MTRNTIRCCPGGHLDIAPGSQVDDKRRAPTPETRPDPSVRHSRTEAEPVESLVLGTALLALGSSDSRSRSRPETSRSGWIQNVTVQPDSQLSNGAAAIGR